MITTACWRGGSACRTCSPSRWRTTSRRAGTRRSFFPTPPADSATSPASPRAIRKCGATSASPTATGCWKRSTAIRKTWAPLEKSLQQRIRRRLKSCSPRRAPPGSAGSTANSSPDGQPRAEADPPHGGQGAASRLEEHLQPRAASRRARLRRSRGERAARRRRHPRHARRSLEAGSSILKAARSGRGRPVPGQKSGAVPRQCRHRGADGYPPLALHPAAIKLNEPVTVKGDVSSQFLTALLMALPLLDSKSRVEVQGELISRPYVEITLNVMRRFGVEVARREWRSSPTARARCATSAAGG